MEYPPGIKKAKGLFGSVGWLVHKLFVDANCGQESEGDNERRFLFDDFVDLSRKLIHSSQNFGLLMPRFLHEQSERRISEFLYVMRYISLL